MPTTWESAITGITLSNGNLTATRGSSGSPNYRWLRSTTGHNTGKRYFEIQAGAHTDATEFAAIGLATAAASRTNYLGADGNGVGYYANGAIWTGGSTGLNIGGYASTDWTRCAVDFDAGKVWFGDDTAWEGDPVAGTGQSFDFTPGTTLYAAFTLYILNDQITANFGASSFAHTPPSGFDAWGAVIIPGTLAATEPLDTASASGLIGHTGTLAATETPDDFTASGEVFSDQSGTIAATETPDGASFSGTVSQSGSISATEAPDAMSFAGVLGRLGTMAASEAEDIVAIEGNIPPRGTMAASEALDTFSAAGVVPYPPITAFLQRSSPGPFITMFQLDLTQLGGEILYFTAGTHVNPTTGEISEIEFDEEVYVPLPIVATGFEKSSKGPLARPRLQVGNVKNFVTTLLNDHGGLLGAKLTRIRTLAQYLDDGPMPDPGQVLPYETYILSRKVEHNKIAVTFELRAAIDIEGVVCPKRVLLRQCSARYRTLVGNDWVYDTSDMACPYTDEVYFDVNNALTTDPTKDNCPRTIPACKARFGENAVLPFIGFPGAARSR